jgi:hypothetical protein
MTLIVIWRKAGAVLRAWTPGRAHHAAVLGSVKGKRPPAALSAPLTRPARGGIDALHGRDEEWFRPNKECRL